MASGARPTVFILERYHRVQRSQDGQFFTELEMWPFLKPLLERGYVVVAADSRGTGASFGSRPHGDMTDQESQDARDLIEWIAKQPWSSGKVGMFGASYTGITQWLAAGSAPQALKAIIPEVSMFDLYDFLYPGGVYHHEFVDAWGNLTQMLDQQVPGAPVDEDPTMTLSLKANAEHQQNMGIRTLAPRVPFRDSKLPGTDQEMYPATSLTRLLPKINASGVAVYSMAGWYDLWPRDHALWNANLTVPRRLLFTPFSHQMGRSPGWNTLVAPLLKEPFSSSQARELIVNEHLRFFDHWLRGIDNGIMNEPPVWYYVMGAPKGQEWQSSPTWPLHNEVRTRMYLGGGRSGSVASINDGVLGPGEPTLQAANDTLTVDFDLTMGKYTRWQNGYGADLSYPDLRALAEKSLTYTTAPLKEDTEITGHPVVHLWVSARTEDADVFAYLEEVDAEGNSTYLTEGMLRASHRKLSDAPYQNFGLPYHRSFALDLQPLKGNEPVELVFDLLPTSNIFDAGHRIRLRITGADLANFRTPQTNPAPSLQVHRDQQHASYLVVPVIPSRQE